MNKKSGYIRLVLPVFIMAGYAFLSTAIIAYSQRTLNPNPAFFSTVLQVISQGSILFLMYRLLIYKKEKWFRAALIIMTVICIVVFVLATRLIIPFELYTIFPFLTAYYGSAFMYSHFSK